MHHHPARRDRGIPGFNEAAAIQLRMQAATALADALEAGFNEAAAIQLRMRLEAVLR